MCFHNPLFSLLSMQVLWLYGNNITWIEAGAFSNLRVLEELDLGDNPSLRHLEGGAFRGLEKLQSLHMHRCKLATLPHDLFHKLYSLQFLYLQVNQCTHTHTQKNPWMYLRRSRTDHIRLCRNNLCYSALDKQDWNSFTTTLLNRHNRWLPERLQGTNYTEWTVLAKWVFARSSIHI